MIDERDKIIEELRATIEAMKCCGNCGSYGNACDMCVNGNQWTARNG